MNIELILSASASITKVEINLDELGIDEETWLRLTDRAKRDLMTSYIDAENDNNRPYWQFDSINE